MGKAFLGVLDWHLQVFELFVAVEADWFIKLGTFGLLRLGFLFQNFVLAREQSSRDLGWILWDVELNDAAWHGLTKF